MNHEFEERFRAKIKAKNLKIRDDNRKLLERLQAIEKKRLMNRSQKRFMQSQDRNQASQNNYKHDIYSSRQIFSRATDLSTDIYNR